MKRWELEVLVDYLRGVADSDTRAAIEADLAAGSQETAADLTLLREVAGVVRADGSDGPSESVQRAAASIFALGVEDVPGAVPLLPFQVQPSPAVGLGLRDLEAGHRDVRLAGERFELFLSIDAPPGGVDTVVVGRLTAAPDEPWSAADAQVALIADDEVLAITRTNRFGEFHIEGESEEETLELRLSIPRVGRIRFSIDRPEGGATP